MGHHLKSPAYDPVALYLRIQNYPSLQNLLTTSIQKRAACFAAIPVYKNYCDEKKKLNYSRYLQCGRTDNYPAARDTNQNVNAASSANGVHYGMELQDPVCLIC